MGTYALLAEALRYPAPGRIEMLQAGLMEMPGGGAKKALSAFVERIQGLSLGEWEELHTRTLDLNPPAAPYLGFQMWGESYKRGNFMAHLNYQIKETGIHTDGELPDHLIPVLRYLEAASNRNAPPSTELLEVLAPAVEKMRKVLRKSEPDNPYVYLFEAILQSPQAVQG
jgi:nitrate reductase delta subunit